MNDQWHPLIKALHWLMAVLLIAMLAFGFAMSRLAHVSAQTGDYSVPLLGFSLFDAYQLHKSVGVLLFGLVLARLVVRLLTTPTQHTELTLFEEIASHVVHIALYVLMFSLPLSGWMLASSSSLGLQTIVFGIIHLPHPISPNAPAEWIFGWIHFLGGCALAALAMLHVLAALKHRFVNKDSVLRSMLPTRRK